MISAQLRGIMGDPSPRRTMIMLRRYLSNSGIRTWSALHVSVAILLFPLVADSVRSRRMVLRVSPFGHRKLRHCSDVKSLHIRRHSNMLYDQTVILRHRLRSAFSTSPI